MKYLILAAVLAVGCSSSPSSSTVEFTCKSIEVTFIREDEFRRDRYERKIVTESGGIIRHVMFSNQRGHAMLSRIEPGRRWRITYDHTQGVTTVVGVDPID